MKPIQTPLTILFIQRRVATQNSTVIVSQINTKISLTFNTNKFFIPLNNPLVDLYDAVRKGTQVCYQYQIWDSNEDLNIYMAPFASKIKIKVSAGNFSLNISEPNFISLGNSIDILSISAKERQEKGQATGKYNICAVSQGDSSYHLKIRMSPADPTKNILLKCGVTRTMIIGNGKMKIFEYIFDYSEKVSLRFALNSLSGNADLYGKFCLSGNAGSNTQVNCTLSENELESPNIIKSTSQTGDDVLSILYDPKRYAEGARYKFLIGVKGETEASFSLSMGCESERYSVLTEGIPFFGTLYFKSTSLFKFRVQDNEAEIVKIVLVSLIGDADLSVSMIDTRNEDRNILKNTVSQLVQRGVQTMQHFKQYISL